MASPQAGMIGLTIVYTVLNAAGTALDISGASVKRLIFKKPDGTIVTKDADFAAAPVGTGDGTDGKLQYVTLANDLEPYGQWAVQAEVTKTNVIDGKTEVEYFDVLRNI